MRKNGTLLITAGGAALALAVTGLAPAAAGNGHHDFDELHQVTALDSPRGVDALGHGRTLVTEGDGSFSLVIERKHKKAKVIELGTLGPDAGSPAIAAGKHGSIYLLTGGGPPPNGAKLFKWRHGWDEPREVADIGAYQADDTDPFDQEDFPEDSNPFGLAALKDGTVLVSDAAGNDLLRVWPGSGNIKTVARLMPRLVNVPEGLPDIPPPDGPLPPAGTPILSEAVATSVTVGPDGYWYVGELRGFPATPKTSQIWRIKPGTTNATCNPEKPWAGKCKRYADRLTSIVDLGATHQGILAVSLSKKSWFQWELGVPGADTGGLFHVTKRHGGPRITELVRNKLTLPSGVDGSGTSIYLTAPFFGPGALWKIG